MMPSRCPSAILFFGQIIHRSLDILDSIESQLLIVEVDEPFAKASRAPHVGCEHSNALSEQGLVIAAKVG